MDRAKYQKRERMIEQAIDRLVRYPQLTYAQVAAQTGIASGVLRGRIDRQYGSLTYARQVGTTRRPLKRTRKCMICRAEVQLPKGLYMCSRCRDRVNTQYDGPV